MIVSLDRSGYKKRWLGPVIVAILTMLFSDLIFDVTFLNVCHAKGRGIVLQSSDGHTGNHSHCNFPNHCCCHSSHHHHPISVLSPIHIPPLSTHPYLVKTRAVTIHSLEVCAAVSSRAPPL